jgi:hypothetical protein
MPQTLIEQARANREKADRAKRLASGIAAQDVVRHLLTYAQTLERLAVDAEDRAIALIEARAKSAG